MKKQEATEAIHIAPPNIKTGEVYIKGTAPLVVHKFSDKAKRMIREKQAAGSTANTKKRREAKDFDEVFNGARHISFDGWDGIPAPAFRNACIAACRLVGFKMTMAKLSIFVEADGFDVTEGTPLVKIIGGEPRQLESMVRLATGVCDISVRPQWIEWGAKLRIRYDADQFTASDVVNLVARAGLQVGVCEGRPGSTNSNGMGWGTFEVSTKEEVMKLEKKGAKK
jgi:hypothetical protein